MRFVQVGVGGFGGGWVRVLKEAAGVQVGGLVDINKDALRAACEAGGYRADICFSSLREALRHVEADAVLSCTPPALHRRDVITAMDAGLNVISEKPMSDSLAGCKAMLRTALRTGRTYVVSQNYRYSPAMAAVARLIRSGRLGAVGQVKLDFYKGFDFGGGFRHSMAYPLIIDMSIHHFDLIRYITGLDAVTVRGSAWNPPWSNYQGDCSSTAVFQMNNGARVIYNGSWCAKGTFCDWNGNWQIECARGTVTYQNGEIRLLNVPKGYAVTKEETVTPKPLRFEGQRQILRDFMQGVRSRRPPPTNAFDNIRSVAMVFATVKAMRTNRTVNVLDADTLALISKGAAVD